jgi:cytochrome b6-f complex iron-sulfur subunit
MEDRGQLNSNSDKQGPAMGRRRLIGYLLGFSVVATLGGVLTPIIGYLWPPSRAANSGSGRVEVGTTADYPVGVGHVVPVNDQPVIVINTNQGMRAYSAICTHLGCVVEWDQERQFILCPCHDGRFNAINGAIISGPVPTPLPQLEVTVEGDAIYVSEQA